MMADFSSNVDPAGDLLLQIGSEENQTQLRVSSKVLSLASPVFAAMLSPRFAEGQKPSEKEWTVSLPDDDAEALSAVCRAIHFVSISADEVSLSLLEEVAKVCDKYDLALATRNWSETALQSWKYRLEEEETQSTKMLGISYIFGNHEVFWMASRNLLFHSSQNLLSADREMPLDLDNFPEDVLGKYPWGSLPVTLLISNAVSIRDYRSEILTSLQEIAEGPINSFIWDNEGKNATTIAHYFRQLQKLGLWPFSQGFTRNSVSKVIRQMSQYTKCSHSGCYCGQLRVSEEFEDGIESLDIKQRGLCLRCVKNGLLSSKDGNCTALIPTDCGTLKASARFPCYCQCESQES